MEVGKEREREAAWSGTGFGTLTSVGAVVSEFHMLASDLRNRPIHQARPGE